LYSLVKQLGNLLPVLFLAFLFSCSGQVGETINAPAKIPSNPSLLLVNDQVPIPQSFKSMEFFRKGFRGSPPILRLDSNDRLILRFDELSTINGQFIVRFSHRNRNWEPSNVPENWLFDGISELTLQSGTMNTESRPNYFSYELEFPNRQFRFLSSGNFMLHIHDFESNVELFSLPFFVTENEGDFEIRSETIFNSGRSGEAGHQLFGTYFYPTFVEFPNIDLSTQFVQNRFWSTTKQPEQVNFVNQGEMSVRLTRPQLFPAYLSFNRLDVRQLSLQNPDIFDYNPGFTPERITLQTDYFNFISEEASSAQNGFGTPLNSPSARFIEATFRFEDSGSLSNTDEVFLIGDFNQWTLSPAFRLRTNQTTRLREVTALIKQGTYSYKYVTRDGDEIDLFFLNEGVSAQPQEYSGFIYYRDPQYQYDRLLNVKVISTQ
jgi:hypothetical protein